ncbi:MAG: hypothetical protein ABIR66_04230, partial [Saprospiraceae bacterium]
SNGLVINEYYRISGTNNASDLLIGGTQDNGQFLRNSAGNFQWVLGGDGMDNYFNSFDNNIVYASSQNGGLRVSSNAGMSFTLTFLTNAGNSAFYPWITPFVQHPPHFNFPFWENTDVIYVYSLNGIMRCTDGFTWININPTGIGIAAGATSPSMVIGSDDGGVNVSLYISNGNNFWISTNSISANPTWTSRPLPISATTFISSMAVNPANRNEVWATISGYQSGVKVFRTTDAGVTWTNLSLSLPNIPIYSIVFANNSNNPTGAVYVGSEIGVFYTDDGIPDWVPFTNRLPHVPVTDLQLNYSNGTLKAATYGRGIWQTDLYATCPSLVLVDYDINQGQYNFESSNVLYAYKDIVGGIGTNVTMKAANQIKLQNGFKAFADSHVKLSIGACGSGVLGIANSTSPNMDPKNPMKITKAKMKPD